jgi:hypothetical protein
VRETAERDRRPRRRLDLQADRLLRATVTARGDAGQHPLEHDPRQRIAVGEMRVGLKRQLAATIGAPDPRPPHRHTPAAERDLARLVPVAHRRTVGIMLALRPDHPIDLLFQQLDQHADPNTDAEREQPLLRSADQLPERFPRSQRQHALRCEHGRGERHGCLLHDGPSA